MSERASGDTEAFSESSVGVVDTEVGFAGCNLSAGVSANSLNI
jgi:hypothetical protein